MLFHPLESALDEASRVLAPGGSFKGIMGGGPACIDETNAVDLYLECLEELPDAERCEIPQLSDIRLRQPGGLRSVLRQHPAFCSFKMTHHHVSQVVSFEEAWTRLSQLYESSVLTDNARSIVKRNFRSRCADKFSRRQIRLAWAVRHFSVERTEYIGTNLPSLECNSSLGQMPAVASPKYPARRPGAGRLAYQAHRRSSEAYLCNHGMLYSVHFVLLDPGYIAVSPT